MEKVNLKPVELVSEAERLAKVKRRLFESDEEPGPSRGPQMKTVLPGPSGYREMQPSPVARSSPGREWTRPLNQQEFYFEIKDFKDVVKWILENDFCWSECGFHYLTPFLEMFPKARTVHFIWSDSDSETDKTASQIISSEGASEQTERQMVIEDAERLRSWLTAILQPLCDADPAALAKYVLALIKKDKPEKELRQSMSDQLDVFLQNETCTFIDKLFELLRTKEYLTTPPPPIVPKKEEQATTMPVYELSSTSSSQGSSSVLSSNTSHSSHATHAERDVQGEDLTVLDSVSTSGDGIQEADPASTDKEDTATEAKTGASIKRERKDDDRDRGRRRRSRSPTRRRRSRSRGKRDPKLYHPRKNWRSTRRNSRSSSPFRSSLAARNRSRSPIRHRRHGSRSRSRSPKTGAGTALNIDRITGDTGLKDGDKPLLQSVVVRAGASLEKIEKGNRCRDFDEKGLCMRGELCPFDHGTDPVVLEDVVIPGVTTPSNQYNTQNITSEPYGAASGSMLRPSIPQGGMGEYYPDSPGMESNWGLQQYRPRMGFDPMMRGRPMMPRPMGPFPPPAHRDLINVPVMGLPMDQLHHPMAGMHRMHMGRGRGRGFDHSRLGFKPARNYANCSLEVKKIPRELNNIMDLNSHFQKFGKIINIQINFESDPEAALVTFSLPMEAQAAYRSTEAVLNNRFIRVFWHSKEKENEETSEDMIRVSAMDRLGGIEGEEMEGQEKILVSGNNITKTVYNPSLLAKKTDAAAEKIQAVEAIKKSQEMLAAQETLKKKQEEKKKETLKIINDLRKRKQTMLDEQIQSQKKLISKLENGRGTMKPEEVNQCMTLIKSIQVQIEKIKKDLEDGASKAALLPKSKEEAEREMLDAELELYNKEQEGGDTYALLQKIADLRTKARALGVSYRGRGGFRGARGFGGRGRGGGRQVLRALRTVDRRPTRIRITGFPIARLPEILPHFSQFGTITEYETDNATPSMMLNFDNRKSSEMAVNNGKVFGESELEITWVSGNVEVGESQSMKNGDGSHQEPLENGGSIEEEELGDILANEILLTYEEDEEDEDNARSWRR